MSRAWLLRMMRPMRGDVDKGFELGVAEMVW